LNAPLTYPIPVNEIETWLNIVFSLPFAVRLIIATQQQGEGNMRAKPKLLISI
jgi:hypothetical protein